MKCEHSWEKVGFPLYHSDGNRYDYVKCPKCNVVKSNKPRNKEYSNGKTRADSSTESV